MPPSHKSSLGGEQGLPAEGPLRDQQSVISSKETEQTSDHQGEAERHPRFKLSLPSSLEWVPQNFTWPKMKLVIRCSVVAWVSILFVIIPRTAKTLGQVDFLVLVAAFIAPPSDSFISVLEQDLTQVLFVTIAWAWSCLGIKLASFARTHTEPNAAISAIFSGQFLEAGPTAVMFVFFFIGIVVLAYIRGRSGPGPLIFAIILGYIALDICFTTAPLFPYPYYQIGRAVVVPIAIKAGLCIFFSALLFPSTISSSFTSRSHAVVLPLISVLSEHRKLLKTSTSDEEFSAGKIKALVSRAEAALAPVAATLHLLKRDIIWSSVNPAEFTKLHEWIRKIVVRADGMSVYFTLIDPTRERFPISPAPSHPVTPIGVTPYPSRPPSPDGVEVMAQVPTSHSQQSSDPTPLPVQTEQVETIAGSSQGSIKFARRRSLRIHLPHPYTQTFSSHGHSAHNHLHHHRHHLSHGSLLHLALNRTAAQQPAVGVFEATRYANLETGQGGQLEDHTERFHALLGVSCDELLEICGQALNQINGWLDAVVSNRRFHFWRNMSESGKQDDHRLEKNEIIKQKVDKALEKFRNEKRHLVIDPYHAVLDGGSYVGDRTPPHRHLFHCYMYQFHLMQFGILVSQLLDEIIRLETERTKSRLWLPTMPLSKIFSWSPWEVSDDMDKDDDEDPDVIPGMEPERMADLGFASPRDPDALPPQSPLEWVMNAIYRAFASLSGGNALFAMKAGVFTIIFSIPIVVQSSALFAFQNKFVWGIIMGQLTLARFRGDTTFGLVSRIVSTFFGVVAGTILWYMSTGTGHGNVYGLAVVCAFAFPLFIFVRLCWPGPPTTNILFNVTIVLVLGYSWLNTHPTSPSSAPHWGLDLGIRRFILATAGVTAAFIFSFLPPSTTLRRYQRASLATTSGEIGVIYCSIVSFANTRDHSDDELQEIIQSLVAIRSKLKRSLVLKANIVYEFSLRGRWPAARYHTILEVQLQIAYLLSHLLAVVVHLEPAWSRAFLRRSRFLDADFQGDVLAVISLISTTLRSGNPLPQITPCPLLERFSRFNHGLNVVLHEADYEYGLPKIMTYDTLEHEQYMYFCVGVTTAFGIVHRLDRLMVATKELVGEQYHIHGVGLRQRGGEDVDGPHRDIRPAKDV